MLTPIGMLFLHPTGGLGLDARFVDLPLPPIEPRSLPVVLTCFVVKHINSATTPDWILEIITLPVSHENGCEHNKEHISVR